MNLITIVGVVADHGSILVLDGYDQTDQHVHVYADRRPAEVLLEALLDSGEAIAAAEDWQIRVVPKQGMPPYQDIRTAPTMVGSLLSLS